MAFLYFVLSIVLTLTLVNATADRHNLLRKSHKWIQDYV
jgi:hypothetical protein